MSLTIQPRIRTAEMGAVPLQNHGTGRKKLPFLRLVENTFAALNDARLISDITDGNEGAFAELVKRHNARFFQLAYRQLQNREQAEDVVQEAFLKIWENPHYFCPERGAAFTTWFTRVVINLCLDVQRRKPFQALPENLAVPATQEEVVQQTDTQRALEGAIAALPERQRLAINLCFMNGLSNRDAASVMGLHIKALESLLMRAKKTLQDRLCFLL